MSENAGAKTRSHLLLCDCEGSGRLDPAAAGLDAPVCSSLCRLETARVADAARAAAAASAPLVIACAQETAVFEAILEETLDEPASLDWRGVDLRDRGFWSDAKPRETAPKLAALLAEAALERPATPTKEVVSDGVCLVYGRGETALQAARRLEGRLSVTCMLLDGETGGADPGPSETRHIVRGRVRRLSGAIGGFELEVDGYAERLPGGRDGLRFEDPKDGARSTCDIVIDLSGETPLAPAPSKRDGYLRADPGDPVAVERALFDAADLVGAFDKTLHIRFEASLCAHSRARQPGCDRCLSVCPTGAITVPERSDHVAIDPMVCAGCGACAAVCPSGAALYDDPPAAHLLARLRTLHAAYVGAGGRDPRLLVHDAGQGREMIALAARHFDGLPADILPLDYDALSRFGHDFMLGALAIGFRTVEILLSPSAEADVLAAQAALAERLAAGVGVSDAGERIRILDIADPEALSAALRTARPAPRQGERVAPLEEGRRLTRQALKALAGEALPEAPIDLAGLDPPPAGGAPYGAVLVNSEACTLCLSCAGLCPSGALSDNPDRPELRFQEDACLQCGICAAACPEDAISYAPRFELSDSALAYRTLHEEEPFHCVACGKPFGVKSTIERVTEKLVGQNWMFTNSDNARLIQMCEDCRVRAQMHGASSPFQLGAPRKPRTTDDYLREAAEAKEKPEKE